MSKRATRAHDLSYVKNLANHKRSQLGDIITWFPAFVIIFVAIIIYLVFVSYMATGKIANPNVIDSLPVKNVYLVSDSQAKLLNFLNNKFSSGVKGKDLVLQYYDGKISEDDLRNNVKSFFGDFSCYNIYIDKEGKTFQYGPSNYEAPYYSQVDYIGESKITVKVGRMTNC
ncbi:MAG: hypothetical protein Q7S56_01045 [Nanoarchaeota archaeon]|nr:hypothetical protein [Nanoarchaeota archaeon]